MNKYVCIKTLLSFRKMEIYAQIYAQQRKSATDVDHRWQEINPTLLINYFLPRQITRKNRIKN
jgi:hypothetical protein